MKCAIEIYIDGDWKLAAIFNPYEKEIRKGTEGSCILEYDHDYVFSFFENPVYALAPDIPVNFETHLLDHWPPFLLEQ